MPNIGPLEIAIVLVIALLVFGPKKLPELGRSLGSGITEFKESLTGGSSKDPAPAGEVTARAVEGAEVPVEKTV